MGRGKPRDPRHRRLAPSLALLEALSASLRASLETIPLGQFVLDREYRLPGGAILFIPQHHSADELEGECGIDIPPDVSLPDALAEARSLGFRVVCYRRESPLRGETTAVCGGHSALLD